MLWIRLNERGLHVLTLFVMSVLLSKVLRWISAIQSQPIWTLSTVSYDHPNKWMFQEFVTVSVLSDIVCICIISNKWLAVILHTFKIHHTITFIYCIISFPVNTTYCLKYTFIMFLFTQELLQNIWNIYMKIQNKSKSNLKGF